MKYACEITAMSNSGSHPTNENELPKLPFKRIKYALDQVVNVAVPLHTEALREHGRRISSFKDGNHQLELRLENTKAAKTVQLLKGDLYDLERLNIQVQESDKELFQDMVKAAIHESVDVLSDFMCSHADILGPFPDLSSPGVPEFPELVCEPLTIEDEPENLPQQVQLQQTMDKPPENWSFLRKELLEINELMHKFALLVIGRQKEAIDTIDQNVEEAKTNVIEGEKQLRKARLLKMATFPIGGALVGGLVLGPVGALVGFKAALACAAGGTLMGYKAGSLIKQKHHQSLEAIKYNAVEMKALKSQ